ncbi:hypothetical protein [Reyranella sp.]|uniref:hypothetical protein n=1 Tax=Reyranella sp. TaxID=1929291 RepID=UPI003D0A11C8
MTVHLPLPDDWLRKRDRRDPIAALADIERAKAEVTFAIELLLERLADEHGISHKTVETVVGCYVHDMLEDVFLDIEEELARQCDEPPALN